VRYIESNNFYLIIVDDCGVFEVSSRFIAFGKGKFLIFIIFHDSNCTSNSVSNCYGDHQIKFLDDSIVLAILKRKFLLSLRIIKFSQWRLRKQKQKIPRVITTYTCEKMTYLALLLHTGKFFLKTFSRVKFLLGVEF
jgi:hypothetical protein